MGNPQRRGHPDLSFEPKSDEIADCDCGTTGLFYKVNVLLEVRCRVQQAVVRVYMVVKN